jgi:phenylalanine-4-hydroxylase
MNTPDANDANDTTQLVELDRDHPGFRDPAYRARRDEIARLALEHRAGQPAPVVEYTPQEHAVWRTALEHLEPLHARYATRAFLARWPDLAFERGRIPSFAEVNARLATATGFRLAPVAGLVTPKVFMLHLAADEFLATQYIRHHSAPLYTPEPDVIHELVGHAALLADPAFARVNRLFGEATRVADDATIERLIRVYWYALEFGVVEEAGGHRVVGAGLLSSYGELGRFTTAPVVRPFDLDAMAATPFDPTTYQATLFAAPSAERLLADLEAWLVGLVRAASR